MSGAKEPGLVLKDAIEMEAQGKEFYERAAVRMENSRAREMFLSLAKQERMHAEILEDQLTRLARDKAWIPLKQLMRDVSKSKVSVFEDKDIKKMDIPPGAGELDVIKVGMEIEKKSIEYYRNAGAGVKGWNAKSVFNWLVAQEAGHLTVLQAEYDYRTKSGFYMGSPEFSLEVM